MKNLSFLLLVLLVFVSAACSSETPSEEFNDLSGGQPAVAEQPAAKILFRDDFSNVQSGWDRVNVESGVTDYADGIYRIFVNTTETDVWANPGLDLADARVEVDATKVGGSDDNDYGVICRYVDPDNFYFFIISSDGYYGIGKVKAGEQILIGSESMPTSEQILKGNATNHIAGECVGSTLRIYINGTALAEYQDSDFSSGDVGVMAGSFQEAGTDIHFDNFVVYEP